MKSRSPLLWIAMLLVAVLGPGCASVTQLINKGIDLGTQIAEQEGKITHEQATSVHRVNTSLEKTMADITPEQEYYIGRAVAATILETYPAADAPAMNAYLNELGQALATASSKPCTFGGYHFLLLDSDEINAFAAPGGFIMVTRGLVRCCRSEDALAAVLAHEIGHVQNGHGLGAIKNSRLTSALTSLAVEAGRNFGSDKVKKLAEDLDGTIDDITQQLVTTGYARDKEHEADRAASAILEGIGYDPRALVSMLEEMNSRLRPGGYGFARTHPSPTDRIQEIGFPPMPESQGGPASRRTRFASAVGTI